MLDISSSLFDVEQTPRTFLVVGLGNPGRQYRLTRHNIGFMVIDCVCEAFNIRLSRMQSEAITGSGMVGIHKVIAVKPQTFMNLSGRSVGGLIRFYQIPLSQVIIIHDDLDLPLGTIRIRGSGSSAGQKGLRSIIDHLGTEQFPRLRMGIGRPPGRMDAIDYVLHEFDSGEKDLLDQSIQRAKDAIHCFVISDLQKTMNQYNGSIQNE